MPNGRYNAVPIRNRTVVAYVGTIFKVSNVSAVLAVCCNLAAYSAHSDSRPSVEIFSKENEVHSVAVSPSTHSLAIRSDTGGKSLLVVTDRSSNKTRFAADLTQVTNAVPFFIDDERLVLLQRGTAYSTYGPPTLPYYYSPIMVDITNKDIRTLRLGRGLQPRRDDRYPLLGHSDDLSRLFIGAYEVRKNSPVRSFAIVAVDTSSGDDKIVATINRSVSNVFVDSDGQPVATTESFGLASENRIWSYASGRETLIYDQDSNSTKVAVIGLTPSREALIVSSMINPGVWQCCFTLSLEDGSIAGPLFQLKDRYTEQLLVGPNRVVYGAVYSGFYPEYEFIDKTMTSRVQRLQALFPNSGVYLANPIPQREPTVMHISGGPTSGAHVMFQADSLNASLLTRSFPAISATDLTPTEVIEFESSDGVILQALLTVRDDVRETGSAALVVIPDLERLHETVRFDWLVQFLANSGFAVLQPQHRFIDATANDVDLNLISTVLDGMQRDLDDGIQFLARESIIDPHKICLVGRRVSAYVALSASAFSAIDYRCTVSIDGVFDLSPLQWEFAQRSATVFGLLENLAGLFGEERKNLKESAPLNNIDSYDSPVLLITGENSPGALERSLRMYSRFRMAGKDARLLEVSEEDGAWSTYDSRRQTLQAIEQFLELHLMDRSSTEGSNDN